MTNLEICIVIKVGLKNKELILYFIYGNINRPNPQFKPFKNVYYIWKEEQSDEE